MRIVRVPFEEWKGSVRSFLVEKHEDQEPKTMYKKETPNIKPHVRLSPCCFAGHLFQARSLMRRGSHSAATISTEIVIFCSLALNRKT